MDRWSLDEWLTFVTKVTKIPMEDLEGTVVESWPKVAHRGLLSAEDIDSQLPKRGNILLEAIKDNKVRTFSEWESEVNAAEVDHQAKKRLREAERRHEEFWTWQAKNSPSKVSTINPPIDCHPRWQEIDQEIPAASDIEAETRLESILNNLRTSHAEVVANEQEFKPEALIIAMLHPALYGELGPLGIPEARIGMAWADSLTLGNLVLEVKAGGHYWLAIRQCVCYLSSRFDAKADAQASGLVVVGRIRAGFLPDLEFYSITVKFEPRRCPSVLAVRSVYLHDNPLFASQLISTLRFFAPRALLTAPLTEEEEADENR